MVGISERADTEGDGVTAATMLKLGRKLLEKAAGMLADARTKSAARSHSKGMPS